MMENGRAKLGSIVTDEEYRHMKETGELNLNDLNRDPQTRAMNDKSINEADILHRAQEQAIINGMNVRRPYNKSESNADFVGESKDGRY